MRAAPDSLRPTVIGILRGITPERVAATAETLLAAGIQAIEIPLNSPDPFSSIELLARSFGDRCLCGAGTVLTPDDVRRVHDSGGRLVVSPDTEPEVISASLALNMTAMPGFASVTEALAAFRRGARLLKLYPAGTYGPRHLKALRAVLPSDVGVYPVGNIGIEQVPEWLAAGAVGFGFGSELFKPAYGLPEIAARARRIAAAVERGMQKP